MANDLVSILSLQSGDSASQDSSYSQPTIVVSFDESVTLANPTMQRYTMVIYTFLLLPHLTKYLWDSRSFCLLVNFWEALAICPTSRRWPFSKSPNLFSEAWSTIMQTWLQFNGPQLFQREQVSGRIYNCWKHVKILSITVRQSKLPD